MSKSQPVQLGLILILFEREIQCAALSEWSLPLLELVNFLLNIPEVLLRQLCGRSPGIL